MKQNRDVNATRNMHIDQLWNITLALNVLYRDNWTDLAIQISTLLTSVAGQLMTAIRQKVKGYWTHLAIQILNNYTRDVATKVVGWDLDDLTKKPELQWTFAGALLYSITVITTIGQYFCPSVRPSVDYSAVQQPVYAYFVHATTPAKE